MGALQLDLQIQKIGGWGGLLWGGRPLFLQSTRVAYTFLWLPVDSISDFIFGLDLLLFQVCPPDRGLETGKGCGCPGGSEPPRPDTRVLCLGGKPHLKPD